MHIQIHNQRRRRGTHTRTRLAALKLVVAMLGAEDLMGVAEVRAGLVGGADAERGRWRGGGWRWEGEGGDGDGEEEGEEEEEQHALIV